MLLAWAMALVPTRPAQAIWIFFTQKEAIEIAFPNGESVHRVALRKMQPEIKKEIAAILGQTVIFNLTKCFQGTIDGQVVGYACIDNVIGRSRPITYMIKIEHPHGDILHYEVMVYREAIGKEVGGGPFREQFYGKTLQDPLEYGEDLRNLAGATMSAVGLRDGFRRLLVLYQRYLKYLPDLSGS